MQDALVVLTPGLHSIRLSGELEKINKVLVQTQSSEVHQAFLALLKFCNTCSYHLCEIVKNVLAQSFFVKESTARTYTSRRLAQNVFSLGNYLLLNKRLIIYEFFTHTSKVRVVILVVRPQGAIRTFVSVCINMLGIRIESYGHLLGPPKFLFDSEKNNFFRF